MLVNLRAKFEGKGSHDLLLTFLINSGAAVGYALSAHLINNGAAGAAGVNHVGASSNQQQLQQHCRELQGVTGVCGNAEGVKGQRSDLSIICS